MSKHNFRTVVIHKKGPPGHISTQLFIQDAAGATGKTEPGDKQTLSSLSEQKRWKSAAY